ncbi:peptidase C39 [Parazoarcus communis]|uniref:Peptidase C39 n=1 Tax=Parazoarcus communis TaxID=41977 RepID=A0A2U8H997_9RHOO|nr:C39 family peptidase [Parazoarcus communis]AWI81686.1 peptidase C39 [Parazoarcus communis]
MKRIVLRSGLLIVVAIVQSLAATTAFSDQLRFHAPMGGQLTVPTVSLKEARFLSTLRQQYDFSCGSAAVATLLTHHYDQTVGESKVFEVMYEHGNQEKIRREGFSMLDMKRYLDHLGYRAEGVEASLDQLASASVPAIALIQENGYAHFVVIKGVRDGKVLLGDPALGTRVMKRQAFEKIWVNSILLVARNRVGMARFNDESDWRVLPNAPIARGLDRNMADVQLLRRGPWDY